MPAGPGELVAACKASNEALAVAEAAVSRVKLHRNELAGQAVSLDVVDQAAAALHVSPEKVQQMAVAAQVAKRGDSFLETRFQ
jgi:phosphoheptose isomerase